MPDFVFLWIKFWSCSSPPHHHTLTSETLHGCYDYMPPTKDCSLNYLGPSQHLSIFTNSLASVAGHDRLPFVLLLEEINPRTFLPVSALWKPHTTNTMQSMPHPNIRCHQKWWWSRWPFCCSRVGRCLPCLAPRFGWIWESATKGLFIFLSCLGYFWSIFRR